MAGHREESWGQHRNQALNPPEGNWTFQPGCGCFLTSESKALMSISHTCGAPLCHSAVSDRGANTGNLGPLLAERVDICKWTDCLASICLLAELHRKRVYWAGAVPMTGTTESFTCFRKRCPCGGKVGEGMRDDAWGFGCTWTGLKPLTPSPGSYRAFCEFLRLIIKIDEQYFPSD